MLKKAKKFQTLPTIQRKKIKVINALSAVSIGLGWHHCKQ